MLQLIYVFICKPLLNLYHSVEQRWGSRVQKAAFHFKAVIYESTFEITVLLILVCFIPNLGFIGNNSLTNKMRKGRMIVIEVFFNL